MVSARVWTAVIDQTDASERLDVALTRGGVPLTRSQLKNAVERGHVEVNGVAAKASRRVRAGDRVTVTILPPVPLDASAEDLPVVIVYEDEQIVVVDKAAGMVVHPSPGHAQGTLVNALLYRVKTLSGIGGVLRPGIVHRLDKETSGLMVVSKGDAAHLALSAAIKARHVERTYVALVHGVVRGDSRDAPFEQSEPSTGDANAIISPLRGDEGRIETLYGRHPTDRKRFTTRVESGRHAAMRFRVLERFAATTLVECKLETGRTHQIRVQMCERGHPVVGDKIYGRRSEPPLPIDRHFLHARRLAFAHPTTGVALEFEASLPDALLAYLAEIRRL